MEKDGNGLCLRIVYLKISLTLYPMCMDQKKVIIHTTTIKRSPLP